MSDKRGVVLIVSLMVIAVILVLTGVYFSSLISEKRIVDTEKYALQAVDLADAGLNYAAQYLKKDCIRCDTLPCRPNDQMDPGDQTYQSLGINCLQCQVSDTTHKNLVTQKCTDYKNANNPLGLLVDFAEFQCVDSRYDDDRPIACTNVNAEARLTLNSTSDMLDAAVPGDFQAKIKIIPDPRYSDCQPMCNPNYSLRDNSYAFFYKYSIESRGRVTQTNPVVQKTLRFLPDKSTAVTITPEEQLQQQLTQRQLSGHFKVTVRQDNFARYALFTNHHRMPSSNSIIWFTDSTNFYGPVATNDRLSFAYNPGPHFTGEVTQHQKKARFYNNNDPVLLDKDYNSYINPQTGQEVIVDRPIFDDGFKRGYEEINLPSSVSAADLKKEALGNTNEPGNSGIYIPNDGTNVTGGIFLKSNTANLNVTMSVDDAGNALYLLDQGSNHKEVTINYTNNTTAVKYLGNTVTYNGIPDGTKNEGVIIYANNQLTLSGTVQKNSAVTVTSTKDIVITNHITYQQHNTTPSLNAEGYQNVLGILSWNGSNGGVRISQYAPSDLKIHAVIMAPVGMFKVDGYDSISPKGAVTLLGGAITDFYGAFGKFNQSGDLTHGYWRNFIYDTRMAQGMAPPYFPYMGNFNSVDDDYVDEKGLDMKLIWQDKG